jgi:citrate lyase subunit beta/citryl-CoA lyase
MPAVFRPRRSVLYMPGANPRALEKARALPADGLIIDLEDAVAAEAKEGARAIVTGALPAGGYGSRELVLRVNPLDTPGDTPILPQLRQCRSTRCCCPRSRVRIGCG